MTIGLEAAAGWARPRCAAQPRPRSARQAQCWRCPGSQSGPRRSSTYVAAPRTVSSCGLRCTRSSNSPLLLPGRASGDLDLSGCSEPGFQGRRSAELRTVVAVLLGASAGAAPLAADRRARQSAWARWPHSSGNASSASDTGGVRDAHGAHELLALALRELAQHAELLRRRAWFRFDACAAPAPASDNSSTVAVRQRRYRLHAHARCAVVHGRSSSLPFTGPNNPTPTARRPAGRCRTRR
jgi:hypothetical protein